MLGTVFVNLMAHITSSSINMVKIKSDDIQTCYGSVRMNDKLDIYLKDYDDFEVLVDDEPV